MSPLAEPGIRLRDERPGEHRCPCPECGGAKLRRRDDALAVKLEPDGSSTWVCHRCSWRGACRQPARSDATSSAASAVRDARASRPARPLVAARLWTARRPSPPATVAAPTSRAAAAPCHRRTVTSPASGRLSPCRRRSFPALLALVTHAVTGEPLTLHRTFLAPDGGGKAPVPKPRLLVKGGDKAGGVVRLWPDAEVATGLCVAEGVETALTAARLRPRLGLPGRRQSRRPARHRGPDRRGRPRRAEGKRAGRGRRGMRRRWLEAGREVRVWKAPAEGADLNDYAREAAA